MERYHVTTHQAVKRKAIWRNPYTIFADGEDGRFKSAQWHRMMSAAGRYYIVCTGTYELWVMYSAQKLAHADEKN